MKHSDLVTVGWAYGQADLALAAALLGSAGIRAFPHSWYMASVDWAKTHALGGIALQVPAEQAADALTLLDENPITRRPRSWLWRLLAAAVSVAVLVLIAIPPPSTGFFAAALRPAPARAATPPAERPGS